MGLIDASAATGQRWGDVHIIDVLRGADTQRIRQFNHQNLKSYGAGKELSKPLWQAIIRQMVSAGYLKIDITGYGGLHITEEGRLLQLGEAQFFYRKDKIDAAAKTVGASGARKKSVQVDGEVDEELYAALKALRTQIAKRKRLRPYLVFKDQSLADMAVKKPQTVAEFEDVYGVGKAKSQKFAKQFMEVIERLL